MKRLLKPIIITTILMLILGGAAFFFLKNSSDTEVVGEFHTRRDDDQSDQTDSHAFRSDMKSLAVDLVRQGEEKNVLNFDEVNVFSVAHSKESRDRLDRLIRRQSTDFEHPIIAYNPFGTMPNTYYFCFKTPQRCMVKYTITVEDEKIPDHIRYVNNGEVKNMTNEHEFVVGGLIPGMENYIVLELLDENGSHREDITYKVMVPTEAVPAQIPHERGKSDLRLQNGSFFVMPKNDNKIYVYDNIGVLRGVVATESGHGNRIYSNEKHLVYQISPDRVIRVNKLGQIEGISMFDGRGGILDFAYDDFENVFALVKDGKRYQILMSSMVTGQTKEVYTFDKGAEPTSISEVSGGNLYISLAKPMGLLRLDGLISKKARVGLVLGRKEDWKKYSVKKKVILDPTEEKKKKDDEEKDSDKKSEDKDDKKAEEDTGETPEESAEGEDAGKTEGETAEGEAGAETAEGEPGASAAPEKAEEKPIVDWDMTDTMLYLVDDESNGTVDTMTFAVKKNNLIHAIKLKIDGKKKTAEVMLDKDTEFDGRVIVQWGQRGSCVIANRSRGRYEERDESFKVTRTYSFPSELDGLWKLNLEGMCFY